VAAPYYALEHFYQGQVTSGGRGQGELRMLAASIGIGTERAAEVASAYRVLPDPHTPAGTWALIRGATVPFLLVQAVIGTGGQPMRHIIVAPPDILRVMGGNLKALTALIHPEMPVFETMNNTIPALTLPNPPPFEPAVQEGLLLGLLDAARDRFDTIEALLAALVAGTVIFIHNAPPVLETRLAFIEGLLAMLPPPVRFGVTFTTYATPHTVIDAQIRFSSPEPAPEGVLVFDWNTARVSGRRDEDEYSRYIKSLLRLDLGQVVAQTVALTPVAGWRIKRGDDLGGALSYAAYRLKVDAALQNNQPVEAREAARVLIEDPTLTVEQRAMYIRHLLAFALALDNVEEGDLLTAAARGQPELERIIIEHMDSAIAQDKAERVFRRVAHWVSDSVGFKGLDWFDLLHRALLAHLSALVRAGDAEAAAVLLTDVGARAAVLGISPIASAVFETAFPLARQNPGVARAVLALAAAHLESDKWLRIRLARPLFPQLAPNTARLFAHFNREGAEGEPPPGLLASAVHEADPSVRHALAVRLCEMAAAGRRVELLDGEALALLALAAGTEWGTRFSPIVLGIARMLSDDATVARLDMRGRRAILAILLARGAYAEFAAELNRQNRLFYPPDKQIQLGELTRSLFAETPIPLSEVGDALTTLSTRGVKPLPVAMAHFGVLAQFHYAPTLEGQIGDLTDMITGNRLLVEALPPDALLELVRYHGDRQNGLAASRLAVLVPMGAARRGAAGLSAMVELYQRTSYSDDMRRVGLDALRRYVRRLPAQSAATAITALGRQLGPEIREALETTSVVWRIMGGESIGDYAYSVRTAARFLYDTTLPYLDKARTPSISSLISDLDSLSGGLESAERHVLADALGEWIRLVYAAAGQYRAARPREAQTDALIDAQLHGRGSVVSVVEVFRALGGYLGQGARFSIRTERELREHPLGDRAAHILLREVEQITRMLKNALLTLPPNRPAALSAPALFAEIESLWADLTLAERRALARELAVDFQRLAELIVIAADRADPKVTQDDSGLTKKLEANRQRPENPLELYRFIGGYFRARA
jgi:hypothetical protein